MMTRELCIRDPLLIGILVAANIVIWLAYMAISGVIAWVMLRRGGKVPFPAMWWLSASFINACGWTHFCAAIVFFRTAYHLEAAVCSLTAVVSTTTAVVLYLLRHQILAALRGLSRLAESVEKERPGA